MPSNSSSAPKPTTPLPQIVLAYLALIYKHLSGRDLGQAADDDYVRDLLRAPPSCLPESVAAIISPLHLLLRRTNVMVPDVLRVNLVIEIVLSNYVEHVEASVRRLDDYIDRQSMRVNLAETMEEANDLLWHLQDLFPRYQRLQARLDNAEKQVEELLHIFAGPAPAKVHEKAYERLKTTIGSFLGY